MSDFADKSVSSSARSQEDLQFHNAKERRRNLAINRAFESLKSRVPSTSMGRKVKLSKIKTLRLATAYINFLMTQLEGSEPNSYDHFISVINAELNRKNSYTQRIQSIRKSNQNRLEQSDRDDTSCSSHTDDNSNDFSSVWNQPEFDEIQKLLSLEVLSKDQLELNNFFC